MIVWFDQANMLYTFKFMFIAIIFQTSNNYYY